MSGPHVPQDGLSPSPVGDWTPEAAQGNLGPKTGIAELEAEVEHARAIAAISIGQPDRAQNVAYREEMEAKLRAARAEAAEVSR